MPMAWFSRADAKGLASQLLDLTMPSELARAIHHVQSGYFITYFDEFLSQLPSFGVHIYSISSGAFSDYKCSD